MRRLMSGLRDSLSLDAGDTSRLKSLLLASLFQGIFMAFFVSAALALFLSRFTTDLLPYAYIASALVGFAAVSLFSRLGRAVRPGAQIMGAQLGLAAVVIALWLTSILLKGPWLPFFMVVCIAPSITLLDLGFWSLAGRLFDLRQGKRLSGLIGAGEVVSAILGYFLVPPLLLLLRNPVHLLPIAASGLLLSVAVVRTIDRRHRDRLGPAAEPAPAGPRPAGTGLLRDRYFLLLAASMTLFVAVLYLVDFSFLSEVPRYFEGRVPRYLEGSSLTATFLGIFFGITKVGELVVKVFVAGRLVNQHGVKAGLFGLPAALLLCASLTAGVGLLAGSEVSAAFIVGVALCKLVWAVVARSLFDPAYRVLYQPLGEKQAAYQSAIEGSVKQADVLAVGMLLLVLARADLGGTTIFIILPPLLAAWIAVVVALLREYRSRVMRALPDDSRQDKTGTGMAIVVGYRLPRGASLDGAADALRWIEAVDPAAVPSLLGDLLMKGGPPARIAALEHAGRTRNLTMKTFVDQFAASPHPEVRAAAIEAQRSLRETEALTGSLARLAALARSPRRDDRELAAVGAGWTRRSSEITAVLLWDQDRDVRRAALLAAGRTGSAEHRSRIVAHLDSPGLGGAACAAAAWLGDAALHDLEAAFSRASSSGRRRRLMRIYPRIGTPRAQRLLFEKLQFPERSVQLQAVLSLSACGFRAGAEDEGLIKRRIEDVVQLTAWNMAAILDLGTKPATAAVRASLELDVEGYRRTVYRLLSLLYDPRAIQLVRDNLEQGSRREMVYALEIMDLLMSADLKPLLLPLLDRLAPTQCLRRLDEFAPQQRLDPQERLNAILHREHGSVGGWTKACAVQALGALAKGTVRSELVANLFHPDPLLQEAAAEAIFHIDPVAYDGHSRKLPVETKARLDRIVGAGGEPATRLSVFSRALLLRTLPPLALLPRDLVIRIAGLADERRLARGEILGVPAGSLVVTVDGRLGPREAFLTGSFSPVAEEPVHLLCLEAEQLLDLLADHEQLLPVLLDIHGGQAPQAAPAHAVSPVVAEAASPGQALAAAVS